MTSTATATCFYHLYRGLLQYSPNLYLCVNLRLSHSFVQNSPVGFHLTLNNSQNPYDVHKDLYDLPRQSLLPPPSTLPLSLHFLPISAQGLVASFLFLLLKEGIHMAYSFIFLRILLNCNFINDTPYSPLFFSSVLITIYIL